MTLYYGSDAAGHAELWVTTRASATSPWGPPVSLATINTTANEAFPALSGDGLSLFFSDGITWFLAGGGARPGGFGGGDLWVTTRQSLQAAWQSPINLGAMVNTASAETTPAVSTDGRTLIFGSNRLGGSGDYDLWMTTRTNTSDPLNWSPPINLGSSINSTYADGPPTLCGDGLALYFASARPSPGAHDGYANIWVARRDSQSDKFGKPVSLGAHFLAFHHVLDPYFSADGSTLFFTSRGRLSNLVSLVDIWQVPVLRPPRLYISPL